MNAKCFMAAKVAPHKMQFYNAINFEKLAFLFPWYQKDGKPRLVLPPVSARPTVGLSEVLRSAKWRIPFESRVFIDSENC